MESGLERISLLWLLGLCVKLGFGGSAFVHRKCVVQQVAAPHQFVSNEELIWQIKFIIQWKYK